MTINSVSDTFVFVEISVTSAGNTNGSTAAANGPSTTTSAPTTASNAPSQPAFPQDQDPQLSPFAQILSELQQLQQQNPSEYAQVTQEIATNLQSAAQADQANGNSTGASQLTQLATDFSNASQSGQLPDISDLAHAVSGGSHHHHGHHHWSSDSTDSSSQTQSSAAAAYGSQSTQQNPLTVILNTLSSAENSNSNS